MVGSQLVDTLNGLVEELIKENRRLQKQVEKLSTGGGATAAGLERGLKAIQKRIERTLAAPVKSRPVKTSPVKTGPAAAATRLPTRARRRAGPPAS